LSFDVHVASIEILTLESNASMAQVPFLRVVKVKSRSPSKSNDLQDCSGVKSGKQEFLSPIVELLSDLEGELMDISHCSSTLCIANTSIRVATMQSSDVEIVVL